MSRRVADPHVPRGEFPPPARRLSLDGHHRRLVEQAARIHAAQECGPRCPLRLAAEGDEAAMAEVIADAMRRRLERE